MKHLFATLSLVLITAFAFGQINETEAQYYIWKGNKTDPHEGYIVLRSGKRLAGVISLKGSPGNVEKVNYVGDGKDIDFPPAALSAYGLKVAASENESAHLFEWRNQGVVMEKVTENTKPRQGYIIDADGNKYEGELQLIRHDGVFTVLKIKLEKGKKKFAPSQVSSYGIILTIAELTKNGEKVYNDNGRNFHNSSITYNDGTVIKGWVAFRDKDKMDTSRPGMGNKWIGVYYTPEFDGSVDLINTANVKSIEKDINGIMELYIKYDDGFVSQTALDGKEYKDATKEFNPGQVTLNDGTVLSGQVSQVKNGGRAFPNSIVYKQGTEIAPYEPSEISGFTQVVEGQPMVYMNYRNTLVQVESDGNAFRLYRNPFPTSTNKFLTGLTSFAIDAGTSAGSSAIANGGKNDEFDDSSVDSVIQNTSTEELYFLRDGLIEASGYLNEAEFLEKSQNEKLKDYVNAINLEIAGREISSSVDIKNKEWILETKATGDQVVFTKGDFKEQIEPLLMGCYTYLEMEKKEQRQLLDHKAMIEAVNMLNSCY